MSLKKKDNYLIARLDMGWQTAYWVLFIQGCSERDGQLLEKGERSYEYS